MTGFGWLTALSAQALTRACRFSPQTVNLNRLLRPSIAHVTRQMSKLGGPKLGCRRRASPRSSNTVGSCVIDANQAVSAQYQASAQAGQTITVR